MLIGFRHTVPTAAGGTLVTPCDRTAGRPHGSQDALILRRQRGLHNSRPTLRDHLLGWQDMVGLRTGQLPRFVKQYADVHAVLLNAARDYAADVAAGTFPGPEHTF
ncbi:3-methyl-2-oxobutanoate hydroxymethyltransferase [Streptomyces sp. GESEQ-35]|uniref:3-methyl-2-oxobutanoate hydroxymethyltransferase n=1 Tax=Streptomyces sp. GESEQ-35 TaxID=2812657 RepID=UPI0024A6A195|nr:3-methyl-2-oxobutanoate hydroxymethyltransferase [Streptomyces sp. GESEQ-35]